MNGNLKRYLFLILAIFVFVIAGIIENRLIRKNPEKHLIKKFQVNLNEKEDELVSHIKGISEIITDENFTDDYLGSLYMHNHLLEKEGYGFLVYDGDELKYWSDRAISFSEYIKDAENMHKLVRLPNGYFLSEQARSGNLVVVGLILIKNDFSHENDYLKNTFQSSFNLPKEYLLIEKEEKNSFPIYSSGGKYLFSVQPAGMILSTKAQLYVPGIIYLIGLILLLIFIRREFVRSELLVIFKLFVLGGGLFCLYWIHILFEIPKVFYALDFFSPDHFGYSSWLPSLGDFFLASVFFFFWGLNLSHDLDVGKQIKKSFLPKRFAIILILFLTGGLFLILNHFIKVLIENSSFSFSLNHITELSAQSIVAYFSMGFNMLGLAVIVIKTVEDIRLFLTKKTLLIYSLIVSVVLGGLQLITISEVSIYALALFLFFISLLLLFSRDYLHGFTLSYLIIFISLFSVYSLFIIYSTISSKEREVQRLLAVNLVTEHDPAAELFLNDIQNQINIDSVIPTFLIPPFDDLTNLEEYILNKYFGGFFRKYETQVTICTGADSINIQPDNITVPCFPFFEERIEREGLQVMGSNFYFMDNMNGRITYFGNIHYPLSFDSIGITVFIELNSSIVSEGLGYPELLMDKSMKNPDSYNRFNYGKYVNGQLVDKHGDYLYNYYIDSYEFEDKEFSYKKWDGYEHIIYHIRADNYVIVSRETYGFLEYLISFPYLFVFFFLFTLLILVVGNQTIRKRSMTVDLKFKVQASIISIVLFSMLIVALGIIFFNIEEYKLKHREDLNEKMKSIAEEIEMRKDRVENLNEENLAWLFRELAKLSNVFRTDVNVYGTDGNLIATSRPEVYEKGLISTKINSEAYYRLFRNYQIKHFQPEKIGELSYLSAYEPIINDLGNYIGFINLPYFTRQDKYSQEISTFIVAFINLYVILFLISIIVAVFISNQITKPLTLIRENLRRIELGKRNEPIDYGPDDEIGSLVREYNKKVDELAANAELIARSERDTAWREMAKQIAHEIKNPLTPMKLNIQYLQRLKGDPVGHKRNIERVTKLLIEQIDDLSSIATEFSNFAKIPTARNQIFNLSTQLRKVIDLFETHDGATVNLKILDSEEINVNADRDQLSRAIINLIKNAIQAIPSNQEGLVDISLEKKGDFAEIKVSDNGVGIAKELQGKLFSPSFTTKTSGMGLGLAIVKNIVENFNGRIWFNTKPGLGTTFFVEIPVFQESEKN